MKIKTNLRAGRETTKHPAKVALVQAQADGEIG